MSEANAKDMVALLDNKPGRGQFRCECCGEIYDKSWSDEKAIAEAQDTFGMTPETGDMAVVCDDCWEAMGFGQ